MRIADLGEFPLIDRIAQIIATDQADILVGVGDDVAVLAIGNDQLLLATVDSQVEGVHFLRHLSTAYQLGRRALAINLSDIAAMGGQPKFALISLALPKDTEVAWVEDLYRGLRAEADRYRVSIVGGNMARSPDSICVDVTLLGQVKQEQLLLRTGARPGDRVLVTGQLGQAAAGLKLALDPALPLASTERETLLARYLTPEPRLSESAVIARSAQATAMLDVSDGLSSDVGHICDQSGVGVRIWADALPVSLAVRRMAELTGTPWWQLALAGGEDFELCFTTSPDVAEELSATVLQKTGTPVTEVGEILPVEQGRRLVLPDGQEVTLEPSGWEHFRDIKD
jgi:thiamine-monophosphate kinase